MNYMSFVLIADINSRKLKILMAANSTCSPRAPVIIFRIGRVRTQSGGIDSPLVHVILKKKGLFQFNKSSITAHLNRIGDRFIINRIRSDSVDFYPVISIREFSHIQLCSMGKIPRTNICL